MATVLAENIAIIDGHYYFPGRAAAYLIHDAGEAAFIDNVTRFSVPYLMQALEEQSLRPEQVRYLVVTHIHLDHSGGTAELAKHCPNATVICHPRAERHIIDPSRLVAGATAIYGEENFKQLYGEIEPVPEERVRSVDEGATLALGKRTLRFMDAPGHAKHHFTIHDSTTNTMFTGDAFGLCYPQLQTGTRPYLNYVCAPPQFDPEAGKETIRKIMASGVERVYVTHFGPCDAVQEGGEQLLRALDRFDEVANEAAATDLEGQDLMHFCSERALAITHDELRRSGLNPEDETVSHWSMTEHLITSQGIQVLAENRRSGKA